MLASSLLPIGLPGVGHDLDGDVAASGVYQRCLDRLEVESETDQVDEIWRSHVLDQVKPTLECLGCGQETMQRTHAHGVRTVGLELLSD